MNAAKNAQNVVVEFPDDLKPGDLLLRRLHNCDGLNLYHYGCYAGRDHLGNHLVFEHSKGKQSRLVTFRQFALHYEVRHEVILNIDREAALARMRELLVSPIDYREVLFNCEHAARYIAEGNAYSWQVRSGITFLGLCLLLVVLGRS